MLHHKSKISPDKNIKIVVINWYSNMIFSNKNIYIIFYTIKVLICMNEKPVTKDKTIDEKLMKTLNYDKQN